VSELNSNESRLAELKKLGELKESGLLSDEEFEAEKNRILNGKEQSSEGGLYKAGSYKNRPATFATKFGRNPIRHTILTAFIGLLFIPAFLGDPLLALSLLIVIEIILFFVSRKREKKIGLVPVFRSWLLRKKEWRWTHWTLSLVVAAFILLNVGSAIVGSISNSIEQARVSRQVEMPDFVGMSLQGAQNCLQNLGFSNFDYELEDASVSKSEINDLDWSVTRQSRIGTVSSNKVKIILYAAKMRSYIKVTSYCR
jgi:hypothetical protein